MSHTHTHTHTSKTGLVPELSAASLKNRKCILKKKKIHAEELILLTSLQKQL